MRLFKKRIAISILASLIIHIGILFLFYLFIGGPPKKPPKRELFEIVDIIHPKKEEVLNKKTKYLAPFSQKVKKEIKGDVIKGIPTPKIKKPETIRSIKQKQVAKSKQKEKIGKKKETFTLLAKKIKNNLIEEIPHKESETPEVKNIFKQSLPALTPKPPLIKKPEYEAKRVIREFPVITSKKILKKKKGKIAKKSLKRTKRKKVVINKIKPKGKNEKIKKIIKKRYNIKEKPSQKGIKIPSFQYSAKDLLAYNIVKRKKGNSIEEIKPKEDEDVVSLNTREFKYYSYLLKIKRKIEMVWSYPRDAAERGEQGEVKIIFTIKKDGTLADIKLTSSSGYKKLDMEAIRAVKVAAPFNPIPKRMHLKKLHIIASFEYRISPFFFYHIR